MIQSENLMQKSLCDSDFYPLLDPCTKWMTSYDRDAYRQKHNIPRTIDEWIENEKLRTVAPKCNPHKRSSESGEYLSWQDDVECILNVICEQEIGENNVRKPDKFTLSLHIRIPPTSSFLMHYWHSPTVIIDQYAGDPHEENSPDWLETVQTQRRFWQGRTLMLAMMTYFSRIPQNSRVSKRVVSWCNAMSIPAYYFLRVHPIRHYGKPLRCAIPRSHKLRASSLSAEESQKRRKKLNGGSPSRKEKFSAI